jgi:hypothetical protein
MPESKMKNYELHLLYFKQGYDLQRFMDECENNVPAALRAHAAMLKETAGVLDRLAAIADKHPSMEIHADTHYIGVTCAADLGDKLVAEQILDEDPFDYDTDEEVDCEDDDFTEDEEEV